MSDHAHKLLSHRLRGFGATEHTMVALEHACSSRARYLEVDTRASRDGNLYLSHDDSTAKFSSEVLRFSEADAAVLDRVRTRSGARLLSLREAMETFIRLGRAEQRLVLDIKDYGVEEQHLETVRDHGLEQRVSLVSWIPQTLIRLKDIGCPAPLVLSYWNVLRLGSAGALLTRMLSGTLRSVGHLVTIGRERAASDLGGLDRGFQHGLVCRELPRAVEEVLAASGGGICIHKSMVCREVLAYCRSAGLELWVFSVQTPAAFRRYASIDGIDVVFSDEAGRAVTARDEAVG